MLFWHKILLLCFPDCPLHFLKPVVHKYRTGGCSLILVQQFGFWCQCYVWNVRVLLDFYNLYWKDLWVKLLGMLSHSWWGSEPHSVILLKRGDPEAICLQIFEAMECAPLCRLLLLNSLRFVKHTANFLECVQTIKVITPKFLSQHFHILSVPGVVRSHKIILSSFLWSKFLPWKVG